MPNSSNNLSTDLPINSDKPLRSKPIKLLTVIVVVCGLGALLIAYAVVPELSESTDDSAAVLSSSSKLGLSTKAGTNATAVDNADPDDIHRTIKASPLTLAEAEIDKVYVDKSTQKLYLMQDGKAVKSYHTAMGDIPKGHKQQEGDERTPEGIYTLDWKNENSIAYRSIHVSYPNAVDKANAQAQGVSPGGDIMIHGQLNGYGQLASITQRRNWTDGCMAVTDAEMDEIMDAVKVGTPIEIVW